MRRKITSAKFALTAKQKKRGRRNQSVSCLWYPSPCWLLGKNRGCTTFGCSEQHYEVQGTNSTEVCNKCGAPLAEGQEFCAKCGQKVGVMLDPNVSNAINQFNANIKPEKPKKGNACSVLAMVFGSIGLMPLLNILFLPPAIILVIIGLCISKNRKKGRTIADIVVVSVSLIVSLLWMGPAISGTPLFGKQDFNDMYSDIKYKSWCEIASDGSGN